MHEARRVAVQALLECGKSTVVVDLSFSQLPKWQLPVSGVLGQAQTDPM
jgi:hypothetical protein